MGMDGNMSEEFKKGYKKGYEDGLREVINEAISLINRGHQPQELRLMLKSKLAVLDERMEPLMMRRVAELNKIQETSELEPGEDSEEMQMEFSLGSSYIIKESKFEKSVQVFSDLVKDRKGLCITRVNPLSIEEFQKRKNIQLYWLTAAEKPEKSKHGFISPTDLVSVASTISDFLKSKKSKHGIVLLQGAEYLISQNRFNSVLKMIQRINDYVVMTKSILLLSLNPSSMDQKDYNNLLKEMTDEV
jgi:hypothetical protein